MEPDKKGLTNGVAMLHEWLVDVCGVCVYVCCVYVWFEGLAGELRKKAHS